MKTGLPKLITMGVFFIFALTLTGCRTAPVYNVSNAPINVNSQSYTASDVKKVILSAGVSLGWQMKAVDEKHIIGTLFLREHMAKVDIIYDKDSYNINYKDSQNLKYDGSQIHSNYNGWIQRLDQSIQARLSGI